ncbi:hypothetical protein RCL2_001265200 [Rhizophagus clarus]|nr:hypothetical protein RCL2_001265200 [Rhizophagus clarus]
MVNLADYKSFAIFPALNVARLGNADEYYVCSEIPGVYVGKGNPKFKFKDDKDKSLIKPQAARFRIYGYDEDGNNLGEINLKDNKFKGKVTIKWTVVLANKKASHKSFSGIKETDRTIRNADWPYNRSTLEAISEQTLASDDKKQNSREFKARVYRYNVEYNVEDKENTEDGHELYLGKMIIEKEGSLLIIGGKGKSGCIKNTLITDYANNDYWYDDTSDGSIEAIVKIDGTEIPNRAGKSWVLVAPPKFAPGIPNLVSLYQVILETQHPVKTEGGNPVIDPVIPEAGRTKVEYYRDIYPIFETVCKNSWVNERGYRGHGLDKPGNFLSHELEKKLSTPPVKKNDVVIDEYKDLRVSILSRVRIPPQLASSFERNGQAYDYFMPPLSGGGGDVTSGYPDTYLTITRGQYLLLKKWADGDFETGSRLPEYKYNDNVKGNDSRKPTYLKNGEAYSFQEICPDPSQQVKFLNKAALEWCVGGPFFPGIEMTYLAYNEKTFCKGNDFRINSDNIQPGDINAYMALPWQADFSECNTYWWPAQRPDIVMLEDKCEKIENREIQLDDFVDWTRGFRTNEPINAPKWADMDMVNLWNKLGFIVEKQIPNNINAFVEVERDDIYRSNSKDTKEIYTLDNLHKLLGLALQVELATIPPYLYAMYSIKRRTDIDVKPRTNLYDINDMIMHKIRHVAAEEMLHASLVANLIAAIGRQPVFYSPEMIPYYPNPLPHFKHGLLMVHLAKADVENFKVFIDIEEPAPNDFLPSFANGISTKLSTGFKSIGELYCLIEKFFEKVEGIPYDTKFQLKPGMGYAPSTGTGKDGLIIVNNKDEAKRAIQLIIDQGEGKPAKADMTITATINNGKIRGETSVKDNKIKIEGILEGDVKGDVKKGEETGTIEGRIEKAKIQGIFDKNTKKIKGIFDKNAGKIKQGKIIEGVIKGVTKFKSGDQTIIERIIEGGCFEVEFETIGEGIKFERSIENLKFENGNIEEYSHYNTFKICKIYVENASDSEYRLWPVIDDPNAASYVKYPNINATATAFNAAYSYLMLLLQNAWRTSNKEENEEKENKKKKELVIGGMPALMHGVLKPIATFLAELPITADKNAGATFGYYEFTDESSPKQQLIAAVQEAYKAFPKSNELGDA